jgi:hypothetical protein
MKRATIRRRKRVPPPWGGGLGDFLAWAGSRHTNRYWTQFAYSL